MKEEPEPTVPVRVVEIVPDDKGELHNRSKDLREGNRHLAKRKRGLAEPECSQQKRSLQEGFVPLKSARSKDEAVVEACARKQKSARATELDAEQAFNAAQALYALFGGVVCSPIPAAIMSVQNVHWTRKRQRSSRSRKPEYADKLSDSPTRCSEKPPVLDLFPSYAPCMQVVQTGNDLTKQEEDTVMEERSGATAGVGMDLDSDFKQQKPGSESSLESMQPNSRAESPSSPLPALKSDATLVPKIEKEVTACSAVQQVTPMQPIKKLSILHKPKVEENIAELTPVRVAPKLVIRKKPRLPPQHDGPSLQVNAEDVGLQAIPLLGDLPNVHGGEVFGHGGMQMGSALINLNEAVKPEVFPVKLESRPRQRSGAFASGKLKAMSEEEKEARRLHRVQANRESARQTIRRKQMLCEQLVQKAASLLLEKQDLKQKLELQTAEYKALLEVNHCLKEQASLLAANGTKASPSSMRPGCAVPLMPVAPYTRLPLPQFWWAFAFAQVAAASQASAARVDRGFGSDYSSAVATATMAAATAAANAGISQDAWRAAMSSVLPFATNLSSASYFGQQLTAPAISEAMPVAQPTSQPSSFSENADATNDGETKTCKTCTGLNNGGKHVLCSPLEDGVAKSEEHVGRSEFQVGRNIEPLDSSAHHQSLPLTGMAQPSFKAEGRRRASSSSLHPGDASCYLPAAGQMPRMSKLANPSVFSSFGGVGASLKANCGTTAPGLSGAAAAAATEARRQRRELKQSRSLQSRQVARLPNTRSL